MAPSIHVVAHNYLSLQVQGSDTFLWSPQVLHACGALIYMQAKHSYQKKKKQILEIYEKESTTQSLLVHPPCYCFPQNKELIGTSDNDGRQGNGAEWHQKYSKISDHRVQTNIMSMR